VVSEGVENRQNRDVRRKRESRDRHAEQREKVLTDTAEGSPIGGETKLRRRRIRAKSHESSRIED